MTGPGTAEGVTRTLLDGTRITDHRIEVPLDWSCPGGERISLYAREFSDGTRPAQETGSLPWLLFLQAAREARAAGPPGSPDGCRRPPRTSAS